ncbi:MAG TPA: glycosyltransferase [Segetibacter sp.]|jgi:GT2 family glycosyltransferase
MISIIVCSIHSDYLSDLKKNIDENIGVEHEWLIWDNRMAKLGLCKVYNMMAEKSQYPYLCFIHEDVLINKKKWGSLLIKIADEKSAELIGVAGGKYKSEMFSGWYSGGKELDYFSVIHRKDGNEELMHGPEHWEDNEVEVATIDGVFMFSTKLIWQKIKFNEELLKGFHYYDIDFSLRVAQHGKVLVTKQLNLVHFSTGGDFGDSWVRQTIGWHKEMKETLPFSIAENVEGDIDLKVAKYWLDWLKNMQITWSNKFAWIELQGLHKHPSLWYSILKFLLYKPLHIRPLHLFFKNKLTTS